MLVEGVRSTDGAWLHYHVAGPPAGTAVLLCHSLGTSHAMWTRQIARLASTFHIVAFDARGHGRSSAPVAAYTLDELGHDALAVLSANRIERACVLGLSMGGLVAEWLAVHAPDRVCALVLANTAARLGTRAHWTNRMELVRTRGMEGVAESAMATWFTASFRQAHPDTVERFRQMLTACTPDGYIGCCAALRDGDLRGDLRRIRARTLIIAGTHDTATTVADAELLRDGIAGAKIETLDAAHLSNVEAGDRFTELVERFLRLRSAHG